MNERGSWHWCWRGTSLKAVRGFWALGEALVDAVGNSLSREFLGIQGAVYRRGGLKQRIVSASTAIQLERLVDRNEKLRARWPDVLQHTCGTLHSRAVRSPRPAL